MRYPRKHIERLIPLAAMLGAVLALNALAACNQLRAIANNSANATETLTSTPTVPFAAAGATDEAAKQQEAQREAADYATEIAFVTQTASAIALTPTYTRVPSTPPPTPTYIIGMFPCNSEVEKDLVYFTCWQGYLNGQLVLVAVGKEVSGEAHYNAEATLVTTQHSQAMVLIGSGTTRTINGPIHFWSNIQSYDLPLAVEDAELVSVNGTRLTITTHDSQATPANFVFDLATRQWVSP